MIQCFMLKDGSVTDMTLTVMIAAIGIGTSFLALFLMEKFGNRDRIKEIQNEINRINKEMMEATKHKDNALLAKLEKEGDKLPALMQESMVLNLKSTFLIIAPIYLLMSIIIRALFPSFEITLPFNIPTLSGFNFLWRDTFGPWGWFLISSAVFNIIFQPTYSYVKGRMQKKEQKK